MKTLNDYLKIPYRLEIVPDTEEGGFVASYPDLPGCVTCGESAEQAAANAFDAKKRGLKQLWRTVRTSTSRKTAFPDSSK